MLTPAQVLVFVLAILSIEIALYELFMRKSRFMILYVLWTLVFGLTFIQMFLNSAIVMFSRLDFNDGCIIIFYTVSTHVIVAWVYFSLIPTIQEYFNKEQEDEICTKMSNV